MKIKTENLIGAQLNWAVAKCEGIPTAEFIALQKLPESEDFWKYHYSTSWAQGGPLLELEGINLSAHYKLRTGEWQAWCEHGPSAYGPTPLIAAMRCYVASELGDEIEIPEELI